MTLDWILNCVMCFLAGGGMMMLVLISAQRPSRKVLAGWMLYIVIALALAYKLGKVVLL
jgi:hypothetical protein